MSGQYKILTVIELDNNPRAIFDRAVQLAKLMACQLELLGTNKLEEGIWAQKKTLVLEKEPYRYQAALSDLSGSDIKNHSDEPIRLVKVVRDWFVTEELGTGPSHKKIWFENKP